jgi:hypothetical protein
MYDEKATRDGKLLQCIAVVAEVSLFLLWDWAIHEALDA